MADKNSTPKLSTQDLFNRMSIVALLHGLGSRAQLIALKKQLADAEIHLDPVEQAELTKSAFAGLIGDLNKKHPELLPILPTIQEMIDRGLLTLDP